MHRIILDTNFLLLPPTRKIDIFTEIRRLVHGNYGLFIVKETIDELNKIIAEQKGKDKEAAKIALQLIKAKNVSILESKQKNLYMPAISKDTVVDDIILGGLESDMIVATQDKDLKRALLEKGCGIIYAKNKKLETQNVL